MCKHLRAKQWVCQQSTIVMHDRAPAGPAHLHIALVEGLDALDASLNRGHQPVCNLSHFPARSRQTQLQHQAVSSVAYTIGMAGGVPNVCVQS